MVKFDLEIDDGCCATLDIDKKRGISWTRDLRDKDSRMFLRRIRKETARRATYFSRYLSSSLKGPLSRHFEKYYICEKLMPEIFD